MPSQEYYDRLREIATTNLNAAAGRRDNPTVDQWSSGYDGDKAVSNASSEFDDINNAEEFGMTVEQYRKFAADERAKADAEEAYRKSPKGQREQAAKDKANAERTQANLSTDARVVAAAHTHFGEVTPLTVSYFGEGEEEIAMVRQRVGGKPKTCKINVSTMIVVS